MINQSLSSTEDSIKKTIRYLPSSVTPVVKHACYSRHLSSRHQTRNLSGKSQTIIHVTIRSPKSSSHRPKENKSDQNILHSHSISNNLISRDSQDNVNNSDSTPNSARQPQNVAHSISTDVTSQTHRSLPQIFTHTSPSASGNNDETTKKEDSFSNTKDLLENSGKKKKKKCPNVLISRCLCALICLLILLLLLASGITAALLTALIKPDTTITTIITTPIPTTTITTTALPTTTEITTTTDTTLITTIISTTVTISETTTTITLTTSTSLPTTNNANVSSSTSNYYGHEDITIGCLTTLKNITIEIIVQKTVGATYGGAYSTFWGGTVSQSYTTTGTQIIYTWTIVNGQTILCSGGPYKVSAQFNLIGTSQITSTDTYIVTTTTSAGVTTTLSGHF